MRCHYCPAVATTRDHIVPRSRGGQNASINYAPSCAPCNKAKSNWMPTCACDRCQAALEHYRRSDAADLIAAPR